VTRNYQPALTRFWAQYGKRRSRTG